MADIEQIKQLREETSISLGECKKALEQTNGDMQEAKRLLQEWNKGVALKKQSRSAGEGIIDAYIHATAKVGVMIDLGCETDFIAKSDDFKNLAHEICLQIAAMKPETIEELMDQPWVKDTGKTIKNMIEEYIGKVGENIILRNFVKYEI